MLLLSTAFVACEKDEIGGTATQSTAGQWYVNFDACDESGNVPEGFADFFGVGRRIQVLTANTAANNPNEMIVTDLSQFWDFKVKVSCDQQALSFQTTTNTANNLVEGYEELGVTITGGKIIPNAGRQNNGSPADSIVFYVSFDDDPYPAMYGYAKYKVSGIRYSGLEEND